LISHKLSSRNDVWSFTKRVMPSSNIDLTRNWKFLLTQSKNLLNVASGTVCTKPLRICSFR